MRNYLIASSLGLALVAGAAMAQTSPNGAPAGAAMQGSGMAMDNSGGSGSLSARDVTGKRLLDANGVLIGQIQHATAQSATVRTPDGKRIQVDMAQLSLGTGPHTVIETINGGADQLNQQEASRVQAQSSGHPQ